MATTAEVIAERRLARMRAGQTVGYPVALLSDPEIRVWIVPLLESEFLEVLEAVGRVDAPQDLAGMQIRDRVQQQNIVLRCTREPEDYSKRVWPTVQEMLKEIETTDIDEIYHQYQEMTAASSPSLDSVSEEEMENLKVLLLGMDWNGLSGRAWYAAKHFLSLISPSPLLDSRPGYGSTNLLTTTNE